MLSPPKESRAPLPPRRTRCSSLVSLFARTLQQRAQLPVFGGGELSGSDIEERGNRRSGGIIEECADELLQRRSARLFGLGGREVYIARPVVLARQESPVDHDLEQLADARWGRGVGQLCTDLFDRRPPATVEDLHDLALPAGQVDGC